MRPHLQIMIRMIIIVIIIRPRVLLVRKEESFYYFFLFFQNSHTRDLPRSFLFFFGFVLVAQYIFIWNSHTRSQDFFIFSGGTLTCGSNFIYFSFFPGDSGLTCECGFASGRENTGGVLPCRVSFLPGNQKGRPDHTF